jgi:hypothetical protein
VKRARILVTTLVVSLAAVAGCVAPSVPVPPPGPEAMSFTLDLQAGVAVYQANLGSDWGSSWVTLYDDTTGEGIVARSQPNGHVGPTAPWRANDGDQVRIQFERDDGEVSGVCLILHGGPSSQNYECSR